VKIGTRDKATLAEWASKNSGASVGSFADAAQCGDAVVLAVKGDAALSALELAGADALAGKTVMDTTNPIAPLPPVNGVIRYFTNLDNSLMEQLQSAYPLAHFVKVFNSVGNRLMVNPGAKKVVAGVLDQFGWETLDCGAVEAARAIEPLCILWCIPGFLRNEWTHAFKVLHK
jgi:predicted dinucleotide-binding enzyme